MDTDPMAFRSPYSVANRIGRFAWGCVWLVLFRPSPRLPHIFDNWRCMLLRLFGAKIDGRCIIAPTVRIWAPWHLRIGKDVAIDRGVHLYNAFGLVIGDRVVISYECELVTATHDHRTPGYPLTGSQISVEDDCWLAAQAFICPGVTIREGCVIAARSVIARTTDTWQVYAGNPAQAKNKRILTTGDQLGNGNGGA